MTKAGDKQLTYMLKHNLVTKLIDFFLESESPLYQILQKRQSMGSNYANPPMEPLIHTVSLIARSMTSFPENFEEMAQIEAQKISPYYIRM